MAKLLEPVRTFGEAEARRAIRVEGAPSSDA